MEEQATVFPEKSAKNRVIVETEMEEDKRELGEEMRFKEKDKKEMLEEELKLIIMEVKIDNLQELEIIKTNLMEVVEGDKVGPRTAVDPLMVNKAKGKVEVNVLVTNFRLALMSVQDSQQESLELVWPVVRRDAQLKSEGLISGIKINARYSLFILVKCI